MKIRSWTAAALVGLTMMGGGGEISAQEEDAGWSSSAEVSYVLTSGNASTSTLGIRSTTEYAWPNATFQISAGGIRTRTETTVRTATGTVNDFEIVEQTISEVTVERYHARGRYDRDISGDTYAFGGAGWERNTFSGFDNRYSGVAGFGRDWITTEDRRLKTDLGFTYTKQDDVVEDPTIDDSFAGLRGSVEFAHPLSETARYTSELIVDENLSETADFRTDWTNSVSADISDALSLSTTYQILFDNEPALVAVPLNGSQVFTPLDKIDTTFTVTLVVTL
ncbi:MAG: DUF481 domain-containing protein [Longimicrobiales bacterium]|nr:DUF481 domain-containing protein [Longimicrobiales bacterium]